MFTYYIIYIYIYIYICSGVHSSSSVIHTYTPDERSGVPTPTLDRKIPEHTVQVSIL